VTKPFRKRPRRTVRDHELIAGERWLHGIGLRVYIDELDDPVGIEPVVDARRWAVMSPTIVTSSASGSVCQLSTSARSFRKR
jgi:hypothetical protein